MTTETDEFILPRAVRESTEYYRTKIAIEYKRVCS